MSFIKILLLAIFAFNYTFGSDDSSESGTGTGTDSGTDSGTESGTGSVTHAAAAPKPKENKPQQGPSVVAQKASQIGKDSTQIAQTTMQVASNVGKVASIVSQPPQTRINGNTTITNSPIKTSIASLPSTQPFPVQFEKTTYSVPSYHTYEDIDRDGEVKKKKTRKRITKRSKKALAAHKKFYKKHAPKKYIKFIKKATCKTCIKIKRGYSCKNCFNIIKKRKRFFK